MKKYTEAEIEIFDFEQPDIVCTGTSGVPATQVVNPVNPTDDVK